MPTHSAHSTQVGVSIYNLVYNTRRRRTFGNCTRCNETRLSTDPNTYLTRITWICQHQVSIATAISRKLWRHLVMEIETVMCLKGQFVLKKMMKLHPNRPINRDIIHIETIPPWTNSPLVDNLHDRQKDEKSKATPLRQCNTGRIWRKVLCPVSGVN